MMRNRFAALVDEREFANLDENKNKRRRNFFADNKGARKYVVIKREDNANSFKGVSPFLIEKGLSMITSNIQETQRLRNGDLLILASDEEGFQKLLKATKLADIKIKAEEHKFLNLCKGVIYSRDLMTVKEEEITNELKSQKVVKVERIKRKINNELHDTPLHIITFNSTELPSYLKAGFLRLDIRTYFPSPMRCHICQRYGHTKARCERVPVCPKCSQTIPNGHEGIPCDPIKCANCKTEHTTYDQKCPTFQMEKAIIKIKTIERITYIRAKEIYYRQNANTTGANKSRETYSDILKKATNTTDNKETLNQSVTNENNNKNQDINQEHNYSTNNEKITKYNQHKIRNNKIRETFNNTTNEGTINSVATTSSTAISEEINNNHTKREMTSINRRLVILKPIDNDIIALDDGMDGVTE